MLIFCASLLRISFGAYPVLSGAVCAALLLLLPVSTLQAGEPSPIEKYIAHGGYALSRNGEIVSSHNLQTGFIPASTIKLVTSLAALEILGPDYRFQTRLFLDSNSDLYIKGSGDPFLVSEKINEIAELVRREGVTEVRNIVLDDSAFALEHSTDGSNNSTNPYDAPCSALGVNFNSLPLQVLNRAKIKSPEEQTPLLPLMGKVGRDLPSGYHRVNVEAFPQVDTTLSNTLLYCGQLFRSLLAGHGVRSTGSIKRGTVPPDAQPLVYYRAQETVGDLVQSLLLSSSNFMANQLYLTVGARVHGFPASWEKSRRAMADFIADRLELSPSQLSMVEGSGLSTNQRVSPEAMIRVLESFRPYAGLLPKKYGVSMKSGTLKDSRVFCYAGYIAKAGHSSPFVIFLNQKKNHRDRILRLLYQL